MKIRNGFVSNSSSSSFVIFTDDITAEQKYFIVHHQTTEGDTKWHVKEYHGFIVGETTAHTYDMKSYLKRVGVTDDKIRWIAP